eukprot:Hpha_TRINITY_DN15800_c6_g1::TRINITY_DN15800_c6_g1_i2::g.187034::m.187034
MAPKKPPPKGAIPSLADGRPAGSSGLFQESPVLPWNPDPAQAAADLQKEDWTGGKGGSMDMTLNASTDPELFFCEEQQDPDPWHIPRLAVHNVGWKRPYQIFSPFKPVVVRPTVPYDPYPEGEIEIYSDGKLNPADDDDLPVKLSRDEAVARYRVVKQLRNADPHPSADRRGQRSGASGSPRHGSPARRRRDGRQQPSPCYMQAFNSVLMTVVQCQHLVPKGQFLWELIYPKEREGSLWPRYNPCGRYVVRLWFKGAFRKVVIDDRLPTDIFGQSLLTVTEGKEIWPALLAKAMLRVLSKTGSNRLFDDPIWMVGTLLAGYVPAHRSPTLHAPELLRALETMTQQRAQVNDIWPLAEDQPVKEPRGRVVVVATTGDSVVPASAVVTAEPEAQSPEADGATPQHAPGDPVSPPAPEGGRRDELRRLGLQAGQVYHVLECRPVQDTTMVRLASPFIKWRGEGSYESRDFWTPEFEVELGFHKEDRLSNDNQWADMWVLWETFVEVFQSMVVLRSSVASCYQHAIVVRDDDFRNESSKVPGGFAAVSRWLRFKSDTPTSLLCCFQGPVGEVPPASELPEKAQQKAPDKKRASMKPPAAAPPVSESEADPEAPPVTAPSGFRSVLRSFVWHEAVQLRQARRFECPEHSADAFVVTLPACSSGASYQLELSGMPRGGVFAVLCPRGDQVEVRESREELCNSCLGVGSWREEGEVEDHSPGEVTLWFKRLLSVKSPINATFHLTALPPSLANQAAVEEAKAAKPAKGGKGKEVQPTPSLDPLDEETVRRLREELAGKRLDLTSWANLVLLNCDTGERWRGTSGYLSTQLQPRKDGKDGQYAVCSYAVTGESYPRCSFRLNAAADTAQFDRGVPVGFRDVQRREGAYSVNKAARLFRFSIAPQEQVQITAVLRLDAQREVPFTFRITKDDDILWEVSGTRAKHQSGPPRGPLVEGAGSAIVEHVTVTPPDAKDKGASASKYHVECVLGAPQEHGGDPDLGYSRVLHAEVHRKTVAMFGAMKEEQRKQRVSSEEQGKNGEQGSGDAGGKEEAVTGEKAGSGEAGGGEQGAGGDQQGGGEAAAEPPVAVPPISALCPEWDVRYNLKLLMSSQRVTVEEDSSERDRLGELKAEWGREEAPPGGKPPEPKGKGKAAAVPVQQEDLRAARAVRARRAYLKDTTAAIIPTTGSDSPAPEADAEDAKKKAKKK